MAKTTARQIILHTMTAIPVAAGGYRLAEAGELIGVSEQTPPEFLDDLVARNVAAEFTAEAPVAAPEA